MKAALITIPRVLKRRQICGLEVESLGVALGVEEDWSVAKLRSEDISGVH